MLRETRSSGLRARPPGEIVREPLTLNLYFSAEASQYLKIHTLNLQSLIITLATAGLRPPAATRFAPGMSGNPRGRPRNAERLRTDGVQNGLSIQHQAILNAAERMVEVKRGDRRVKVSAYAAIIESIVEAARHGNARAADMFIKLHREAEEMAQSQSVDAARGVEVTKMIARLLRSDGVAMRENEILKAKIAELEGALDSNLVLSERDVEPVPEINLAAGFVSPASVQPAAEPHPRSVPEVICSPPSAPVITPPYPTATRRPTDPLIPSKVLSFGGGYGINAGRET